MVAASSLQQQLTKLASGHRQKTRLRKVASFLFSDEVAQEVSTAQCHKIGLRGLKGLAQLDPRFNHYYESLMDEAALETERGLMVGEEAKSVDHELDLFLYLAAPHFMLSPSHEALEFLLRHYEVHQVMPEAVLRAILPYHDHLYFARMAQLLPLRKTRWSFLQQFQRDGRTLTRAVLAQQCLDDNSLLSEIGEWVVGATDRECDFPALFNLFNGLVVDILSVVHSKRSGGVADRFVSITLPVYEHLINAARLPAQAAGLTGLAILFSAVPLAEAVSQVTFGKLTQLLTDTRGAAAGRSIVPAEHVLKVMALVASQLPADAALSKALQGKLLHFRWTSVVPILSPLQRSNEGRCLLVLLFRLMTRDAVQSGGRRMGNLNGVLSTIGLVEPLAATVTQECLKLIGAGSDHTAVVGEIIRLVERHCTAGFDMGLRTALRDTKGTARKNIFAWMKDGFKGSSNQIVVAGDETEGYSLTVASVYPEPQVRAMAAKEIVRNLQNDGGEPMAALLVGMLDIEEHVAVLRELLAPAALKAFLSDAERADERATAIVRTLVSLGQRVANPEPTAAAAVVVDAFAHVVEALSSRAVCGDALVALFHVLYAAEAAVSTEGKTHGAAALEAARKLVTAGKLVGKKAAKNATALQLARQVCASSEHAREAFHRAAGAAASAAVAMRRRNDEAAAVEQMETHVGFDVAVLVAAGTPSTAGTPPLLPLFAAVREHMALVCGKDGPTMADVALESSTARGAALAKLAHFALLRAVVDCVVAEKIAEDTAGQVTADVFHVASCAAAADAAAKLQADALMQDVLKKQPLGGAIAMVCELWGKSDVPVQTLKDSFAAVTQLAGGSGKSPGGWMHVVGAFLGVLVERHEDEVLAGAQGVYDAVVKAAAKSGVGKDIVKSLEKLTPRLADIQAESLPDVLSVVWGDAPALLSELATDAMKWRLASTAEALARITTMEKLRGFLPTLAHTLRSIVQSPKAALPHHEGVLAAAAVGSFAALWRLQPGEFNKLPDRALILEVMCRCLDWVHPIEVAPRPARTWAYADAAADAAPKAVISLPELMSHVVVLPRGRVDPGFAQLFAEFNEGARQQWLDSLLLLVSSGHAAGRTLLRAIQGVVASPLRLHAALLAGRWGGKALTGKGKLELVHEETVVEDDDDDVDMESSDDEAPVTRKRRAPATSGQGKRDRAADAAEDVTATSLARAMEALVVLHPGQQDALPGDGQDPLAVGALAWRCLRVECGKPMRERHAYLLGLFTTLLANCATEVAACVRKYKETHDGTAPAVEMNDGGKKAAAPKSAIDEVMGNVTTSDRACDVLRPTFGLLLVDLEELGEVLKHSTAKGVRGDGLKVFKALMGVDAASVYGSCLRFVVSSVGSGSIDDLLEEILTNLIPGMLNADSGNTLITLIHIVLYSYASRRGGSEAALDACHRLLSRCNVHYQLVALQRLLLLTVDGTERGEDETRLLEYLGKYHPAHLAPEQIELRVVLFALRHATSDAFIESVLDEEQITAEAANAEPEYFESFTNLFLCLLEMYKQNGAAENIDEDASEGAEEAEEGEEGSDSGSSEGGAGGGVEDLYDLKVKVVHRVMQLLVAVVDVMPVPVFVAAIQVLLAESEPQIRSLGLRLFNSKLTAMSGRISEQDSLYIITMLPELKDVLEQDEEAILADPMGVQSALWTLEILTRHLAPMHPKSFVHFVPCLTNLLGIFRPQLAAGGASACAFVSSVMLTLAHVCQEVETLTLEHLPTIMPLMLDACDDAARAASGANALTAPPPHVESLTKSICAAMSKVVANLSKFMSPYFARICSLATARGCVAAAPEYAEKLLAAVLDNGPQRLVFPPVLETLSKSSSDEHSHDMLWGAVQKLVEATPNGEMLDVMDNVMKVMLRVFNNYTSDGLTQLRVLNAFGDALTALAMRLDGKRLTDCLGMFHQTVFAYDRMKMSVLAQRQLVTYYCLVSRLQQALGGIFSGIFKTFIPQICEVNEYLRTQTRTTVMGTSVAVVALRLIKQALEDDSEMLITKSSATCELIGTQVINFMVSQQLLDEELVFDDDELVGDARGYTPLVAHLLTPILVRLCVDTEDRMLWTKFQKAVLTHFRQSTDPQVRYAVLSAVKTLYMEVGQEFAAGCVAELLPTLAEALDDDDNDTSKLAVSLVKTCSQLTGEDISGYMR